MFCKKCKQEIPDVSTFCLHCGAAQNRKKQSKQRRSNGTGTISKMPGNLKKPYQAKAPADASGIRPSLGYFATKKEAIAALLAYQTSGVRNDKISVTFSDVYKEWSEVKFRSISTDMINGYKASYKRCAALYNIKFRDIRTADLQQIINANSHMSRSSLEKDKALFTQLYKYALKNDIVSKNYGNLVELPKKEKTEKDCFNDIELKKIELAAANGVPYADCILMMCYTGFRISEFLELTPFDYKENFLIGGKKTEAGRNRLVPVHSKIKPYIDKWAAKKGETIICKDDGKPYSAKYFREKCYYPALEQAGVRKLTPHATRHTLATRLAAAGTRPEDIQRILGHADYDVTANTYIHQDEDMLLDAISKIS